MNIMDNTTLISELDSSVITELKACRTRDDLREVTSKYMSQINVLTGQENNLHYMAYYF